MKIDKHTLKDLEIFKSDENTSTVFDFIDKTKTAGGKYRLREMFLNPPESYRELQIQQDAIRYFTEADNYGNFIPQFNGHQMRSFEEYLSSNIGVVENGSLITCARFCFIDIEAYRYLKNSLREIIDFVFAFNKAFIITGNEIPVLLKDASNEIINLMNDADFRSATILKENRRFLFLKVLQSDRIMRTRLKSRLGNILQWYYEIDALVSMAKVTVECKFQFPEIIDKESSIFHAEGLFHPLLQNPVPCNVSLNKDSNFIFLTGPNMAGKTTFLKAAGTAVYLAHLGMGIPVKCAKISYFDRLFTSLNITDSISTGYSFFYSEVLRVKQLAESLSNGEKTFSLFDELFRGTNVKDAYDASVMIISALVKWNDSVFILSSHLWELWDKINVFPNIKQLCFESEIRNEKPVFSYHLKPGISDMRLGITIIKNEKILELLNSVKNDKN